jgi:hypothetical protein
LGKRALTVLDEDEPTQRFFSLSKKDIQLGSFGHRIES